MLQTVANSGFLEFADFRIMGNKNYIFWKSGFPVIRIFGSLEFRQSGHLEIRNAGFCLVLDSGNPEFLKSRYSGFRDPGPDPERFSIFGQQCSRSETFLSHSAGVGMASVPFCIHVCHVCVVDAQPCNVHSSRTPISFSLGSPLTPNKRHVLLTYMEKTYLNIT